MSTDRLLSTTAARAYAGVSIRTLYRHMKPATHGTHHRESQWRIADLDRYLDAKRGVK